MANLNSLFFCFYFAINIIVKVTVQQLSHHPHRKTNSINNPDISFTEFIKQNIIHYVPTSKAYKYLASKGKYKEIVQIKKLLKFRDDVNNHFPILATLLVMANIINIIVWGISKII